VAFTRRRRNERSDGPVKGLRREAGTRRCFGPAGSRRAAGLAACWGAGAKDLGALDGHGWPPTLTAREKDAMNPSRLLRVPAHVSGRPRSGSTDGVGGRWRGCGVSVCVAESARIEEQGGTATRRRGPALAPGLSLGEAGRARAGPHARGLPLTSQAHPAPPLGYPKPSPSPTIVQLAATASRAGPVGRRFAQTLDPAPAHKGSAPARKRWDLADELIR
jgi:hypothetical protein